MDFHRNSFNRQVPHVVQVDGKNNRLSKDDVAVLPAVHARNLRNKNLASEVKFKR